MLRLIAIAVITIVVAKLTTFGWQGILQSPGVYLKDSNLAQRLKQHVIKLSHEIGNRSVFEYSNLLEAADYISRQLRGYGFLVKFQEYTVEGKVVKNIIAEKTGSHKPDEIIIVGAHYDTCFNPGADDNASAVAVLLELAKSQAGRENSRTIRFIAFVNEEPPFFKTENMGSFVYAAQAREKQEDIKAAVILEMLGCYSDKLASQRYPLLIGPFFPNRGNFVAVVGNLANRDLVKQVSNHFLQASRFPIRSAVLFDFVPGVDFSDHWSFWQNGFPAVMLTDTAFYRYAYYHSSKDTYEKLNYQSMAAVVEALEAVISRLSE